MREINELATIFTEICHIAPLYKRPITASYLPYNSENIRFKFIHPSGGRGLFHKLNVLIHWPGYALTILKEIKNYDVIHVRCPSSIGFLALLLLGLIRKQQIRWTKYAGNWKPLGSEPLSYSIQRWLLSKNVHRGFVTVNGEWKDQPKHVQAFLNPCLTDAERKNAENVVQHKNLKDPIQLIFVGRLEEEKGTSRVIEIMQNLKERGVHVRLDLVGDGLEREHFENLTREAGLEDGVKFHGWLTREDLNKIYEKAHFILLPSTCSEGWPKVISEAMAYGVVPIVSDVSSIPQYLSRFKTGISININELDRYSHEIHEYVKTPEKWLIESKNAMKASSLFLYDGYLECLQALFKVS